MLPTRSNVQATSRIYHCLNQRLISLFIRRWYVIQLTSVSAPLKHGVFYTPTQSAAVKVWVLRHNSPSPPQPTLHSEGLNCKIKEKYSHEPLIWA